MILRLKTLLKDPTSKNVIINTIGNYLNVAFTAFFALILVRILDPDAYGVMSVLLGIAYVLANVLEFGTAATIYSTIPALLEKNEKQLYRFIKSTFFFQSIFAVSALTVLVIFFPWLDRVFFKTDAPIWELYLTAIAVLLFIWQNFLTNILFAAKRFFRANLYINAANITKTLFILAIAYFDTVSVGNVIVAFGIVGPMTYFALVLWRNQKLVHDMKEAPVKKEDFQFKYTMTYFASSQFYNLGLRMDLFLLSYFGLREEVGYYGLSQKIILTIVASIVSISQVLSPKFATIKTREEALRMMKIGMSYMIIPSVVLVLLHFTPSWVFEVVFTKTYAPATDVTHLIALPFILSAFGTIPMLFLLYTLRKPVHILISNIAFFLIISIGSYLLIPEKGMYGPPFAIFLAFIVAVGYQTLIVIRQIHNLKRDNKVEA